MAIERAEALSLKAAPSAGRGNALLLLGAAAVLVRFFWLAGRGIHSYFTADELMNIQFLGHWGSGPMGILALHSVIVVTPENRPLGELAYRVMYALFGFQPLAFRVVDYGLLVLNMGLAARFFYALSRSRFLALAGVLAFSFHPALEEMYFNGGTLFDSLAFVFAVFAMTWYVRVRERGTPVLGWRLAGVVALYGLALSSKEMAVTVPVILLVYEFLFHALGGWTWRRALAIGIMGTLTAEFLALKVYIMSASAAYATNLAPAFLWKQLVNYYSHLALVRLSPGVVLAGLAATALLAVALRSRLMILGCLFANLALIPVLVIPARGGFVWYFPLLGAALYLGALLERSLRGASAVLRPLARFPLASRAAAFTLTLLVLTVWQKGAATTMGAPQLAEQAKLKSVCDAAKRAAPRLPKASRILLVDDGFYPSPWQALFLLRLAYHDPALWVDSASESRPASHPKDLSPYHLVMRAEGGRYVVASEAFPPASPVAVKVAPATAPRGLEIRISAPALAGCALDAEYRMPADELQRSGIWRDWTALDAAGQGTARIPRDAESGKIDLQRVRACGREWRRASGTFTIVP